jgi:hypothetical protein
MLKENVKESNSNFTKFGSEIKEKLSNFFRKKKVSENTQNESVSPTRSSFNKNLEKKYNENKQVFTIQEDEDHHVYNYNLEEEYDDEYSDDFEEEKINENLQHEVKDEDFTDEEYLEIQTTCHRLYTKDSLIDLEGLTYVRFHKMKPVNKAFKLFSMIGINQTKLKEVPYIALIDEIFIYTIKDEISDHNSNLIKRAKNHYNIKTLSSIDIKIMENSKTKLSLVFTLNKNVENYQSIVKEFYFYKDEGSVFIKMLKKYFTKYKLEVPITNSK